MLMPDSSVASAMAAPMSRFRMVLGIMPSMKKKTNCSNGTAVSEKRYGCDLQGKNNLKKKKRN
jgi:hypothetical protein